MLKKKVVQKYHLYEAAVQDAPQQVSVIEKVYKENFEKDPLDLKEDFSGTSWISTEWVKRDQNRKSIALDIDDEVLQAAKELHLTSLKPRERSRLQLLKQNVLTPTRKKVDAIAACNFSYFVFRERFQLLKYFSAAYNSLKQDGVFLLETAGGPGFVEAPFKEHRTISHPTGKRRGKKWFRYTWDQKSYDPQSGRGLYAIHFKLSDRKQWKDVFTYDWRIWTIPEVRDALLESGFNDVQVYWEDDEPDVDGNPVYTRRDEGDTGYDTWIVYIVGVKRQSKRGGY